MLAVSATLWFSTSGTDAIMAEICTPNTAIPPTLQPPAYSIAFIRLMQWLEQVSDKIPFLFKPQDPYRQPNPIRPN